MNLKPTAIKKKKHPGICFLIRAGVAVLLCVFGSFFILHEQAERFGKYKFEFDGIRPGSFELER